MKKFRDLVRKMSPFAQAQVKNVLSDEALRREAEQFLDTKVEIFRNVDGNQVVAITFAGNSVIRPGDNWEDRCAKYDNLSESLKQFVRGWTPRRYRESA